VRDHLVGMKIGPSNGACAAILGLSRLLAFRKRPRLAQEDDPATRPSRSWGSAPRAPRRGGSGCSPSAPAAPESPRSARPGSPQRWHQRRPTVDSRSRARARGMPSIAIGGCRGDNPQKLSERSKSDVRGLPPIRRAPSDRTARSSLRPSVVAGPCDASVGAWTPSRRTALTTF